LLIFNARSVAKSSVQFSKMITNSITFVDLGIVDFVKSWLYNSCVVYFDDSEFDSNFYSK